MDSCPCVFTRISVPRGMIMVGKFAWSPAALISTPLSTPSLTPLSPQADKRRWQRIEVPVVLAGAGAHQQERFVVPLVVQDVDARIDRIVAARLFEIAAHFVVEMRVRAPAGRADRGDLLSLRDLLAGAHVDGVAVRVNGDEALRVLDGDDVAEA